MMKNLEMLTLNADETALLIIDVQERLAPAIAGHQAITDKTAALIQIAAALSIPILVTEQYPRGLGSTLSELKVLLDEAPALLGIFSKTSFSALTPEVSVALAASGRKKVIIAGMETHVCVFQTARALQSEGYIAFLAQDAVGSRTVENRQNGLELIAACGAVISNVETILFDLLKEAGTPVFKSLSKLIK